MDFDGSYGVIQLAKDPIANYVVKKALDCAEGKQRDRLFGVINSNRQQLVRIMFAFTAPLLQLSNEFLFFICIWLKSQSPYAKYVLLKLSERKSIKTTRRNKG